MAETIGFAPVPQAFTNFADEMRRQGKARYSESQNVAGSGGVSPADKAQINRADYAEGDTAGNCKNCHTASVDAHALSKIAGGSEAMMHAARAMYNSKYKLHEDAARSHGDAAQEHAYATTKYKDSPSKQEKHIEARAAHETAKKLHKDMSKGGM